jgi:hypothetical protein
LIQNVYIKNCRYLFNKATYLNTLSKIAIRSCFILNNLETEIQTIQPIIEQIFPNIAEVPVNSISSSIYGEGEEKRIYFLIVGIII